LGAINFFLAASILSGCADLTEFKNDSAPSGFVDADEKVKLVSENMTISAQTLRVFN
jgi:hypothetical protein